MLLAGALLDEARTVIEDNLDGLTDAEYLWEPVADCWSVRPRSEVRSPHCWGRGDWVVETSLDGSRQPTMTTIAWRLLHAYDCTNDFTSRAFGRGGRDWNDIDVPATASEAVALMRAALDGLTEDLAHGVDDILVAADQDFGRERWELLGKALLEAIHHCAEIGVLRTMYRLQAD